MVAKTAMIRLTKVNNVQKLAVIMVVVHKSAERCRMDQNVFALKDIRKYKHTEISGINGWNKAAVKFLGTEMQYDLKFDFEDIQGNINKSNTWNRPYKKRVNITDYCRHKLSMRCNIEITNSNVLKLALLNISISNCCARIWRLLQFIVAHRNLHSSAETFFSEKLLRNFKI